MGRSVLVTVVLILALALTLAAAAFAMFVSVAVGMIVGMFVLVVVVVVVAMPMTVAASAALVVLMAVGVSVVEFFGGRSADVDDADFKVERLTGQRMIGVDGDLGVAHIGDDDVARTGLRVGGEVHARLDALNTFESIARHGADELLEAFAVAFVGGYGDLQIFTGRPARQLPLQPRHNLARAMKVGHRITTLGAVDHLPGVVPQCVLEEHDGLV